MDDDLLIRGKGKLKMLKKIFLTATWGMFFLVYFNINMPVISASDNFDARKTTFFKFDPMEKIKNKLKKPVPVDNLKNNQEKIYRELIANSPLEEMIPFMLDCDSETTAFLIAIAKKESDWGRHAPKKAGNDCFNYWGYRGTYNQTISGYSCFDSPEQAIAVVGERIKELLNKKINTAEKMVIWKCGSDCSKHDPISVRKWISDVAVYYKKVMPDIAFDNKQTYEL